MFGKSAVYKLKNGNQDLKDTVLPSLKALFLPSLGTLHER